MLASELAHELELDPSVISKRLTVYHAEAGTKRTRVLSSQTVKDLREAHALVLSGQAGNFRTAVQMALGQYADPIPSESARELLQRMERLEDGQRVLAERMEAIAAYLRKLLPRLTGTAGGHGEAAEEAQASPQ